MNISVYPPHITGIITAYIAIETMFVDSNYLPDAIYHEDIRHFAGCGKIPNMINLSCITCNINN